MQKKKSLNWIIYCESLVIVGEWVRESIEEFLDDDDVEWLNFDDDERRERGTRKQAKNTKFRLWKLEATEENGSRIWNEQRTTKDIKNECSAFHKLYNLSRWDLNRVHVSSKLRLLLTLLLSRKKRQAKQTLPAFGGLSINDLDHRCFSSTQQ